ncbi:phage tail assembly protein [Pseudomonas nunensis]|nr:phage tail assembly protein [Pseudomonas nunensis]
MLPAWLTVAADNVQVTLSCPSEVSSVKLDVLNLRSPTVREVRAADRAANGNAEQRELTLFAELTGASIADLEGLKLVDYYRLQAGYFRLVHDDGV